MTNLGLFILVGTCMLIGSAIASTSKADFLPRTREGRFIAAFLIAVITGIIALVIYGLWSSHAPHEVRLADKGAFASNDAIWWLTKSCQI